MGPSLISVYVTCFEELERLKAALAEEQARVSILSLASFVILKSPTDSVRFLELFELRSPLRSANW